MESWKSHVRAELFLRDCRQRDPFSGLFDKVSRLEEMLAFHMKLWQDMDTCSSKENGSSRCPDEGGTLSLRVNELEFLNQQLKQKISDLTSNIYLKEAELQYCHSQVARYRTEAVVLAQGAFCLKANLAEYEYQLECQSKELTALRLEHSSLREELTAANLQNEQLLDRWLEEKKEEAERINKYNAIQERWQCLAGRLKKRSRVRSRAANSSSEINPTV
ncbi:autophagy-related protein 16-1-like [Sinocyclocheilus rhinocerous]|uniref:autophagy-related protein 16-1-like n=1 Tax=Sinocyclocheilus rhinocerous TaxID=307959 RepID=UPI0007B8D84E|nr:PREDICTED: autophagy-related protein 16-1-like [Sinocyclocheilus rhinocerous]XP_016410754.1 PREDICTED: autophagy-related protein 16-1-like [Sinocyclocheilus rhinocerous]